jgi:thiamine biosynthesis lipoprotein
MKRYLAFLTWIMLAPAAGAAEPWLISGATMGTTYRLKLASVPDSVDLPQLEADIAAELDDVDRRMSTYRPDSEVCRFGRAAAREWFSVSGSTAEVVAAALEVSRQTAGALDVTIGPVVRLWHFGPRPTPTGAAEFVPPAEELLLQARSRVGYEKLAVRAEPPALRKLVTGLEIDLSAVAKGYAVDRVADLAARNGIENFLVEIGGELRAAGRRSDGTPWQVGIERPLAQQHELATVVALRDAALATSGDYRKYFEYQGRRYSHIIDPSTGRPAENALASVTVVAETCLAADAWATALLVLGPQRGQRIAEQHEIAALLMARDAGGRDAVVATSRWRERFGADSLDDAPAK